MAKRRLLVVGYPKSGNTWLTRLTAELLAAPVAGFWNDSRRDFAAGDEQRVSDIDVFRGHHRLEQIRRHFKLRDVVYVTRDVRDVVVSGAHYFSFGSRTLLGKLSRRARRLVSAPSRLDLHTRVERMLGAVSAGDRDVTAWCSVAWDLHVREYLDAGAFVVRYEDMLAGPERECRRLLGHLGTPRSTEQVRAAIDHHSFATAKQRYAALGDLKRAEFLRAGRAGTWIEGLTTEQSTFCAQRFAATLRRLGYPLDGIS